MDRYNDVKLLLKKWEHSFIQANNRKPSKNDIDAAPEETKQLYKEYRLLKEAKESTAGKSEDHVKSQESQSTESECWGSHLNRKHMPAAVPKLTLKDKETLQASAQYFGMRLKSNLGTWSEERPFSLKKSITPHRTPGKSWKDSGPVITAATEVETLSPKPANTCPDPFAPQVQTASSELEDEPSDPFPTFTPSKSCTVNMVARDKSTVRAQFLRQSVTKRLSSVDRGWLDRCQVFTETGNIEKPVGGNSDLPEEDKLVKSSDRTDGAAVDEPVMKAPMENGISVVSASLECPDDVLQVCMDRFPVEGSVDLDAGHSLGAEDVKIKQNVVKETQSGTEEARHVSKTRKQIKKPRLIKAQESGQNSQTEDVDNEPRNIKKRGRKRQRETEEGEKQVEETERVQKKRRTKKEDSIGDRPPTKGRKKKGKAAEVGESDPEDSPSSKRTAVQKPKMPQENLLGEMEEEDLRAVSSRMKNTARSRPTKNTDGNFVKINLKKKSHVKGFALRGAALRKQLYMQKFALKGERFGGGGGRGRGRFGGFSRQGDSCYKCGGTGHWARDCQGRAPAPAMSGTSQQETPLEEEEPFELPTLEEVARATGTLRSEPISMAPSVGDDEEEKEDKGEEILLNVIRPDYERPAPPPPMEPLYKPKEDGKVQEVPPEVYQALHDFGYRSFRPGQEMAIMRILSGLSTLVVLSTGMGKSLCYQLPAYLYAQRSKCITLVVSPLVSLMDDQLSGLPPKLKAACIHSNMSQKQREAAIEKVKAGQVHVLLLSPEALVGGGHSGSGCLPPADQLPPVAFACIDEAHCVSEWSHNFRPCYLRLCKVLRDRLGVRCLLGLTATATLSTALDIARHLDISDQEGIAVRSAAVPHNLQLSVSMDRDKDQALVSLLKGERFGVLDSIIVYCTRREETNRIAALLRTCLQGVLLKESSRPVKEEEGDNPVGKKKKALARKKIRKPLKWIAEAYHAGMSASERRRVQNNFMCGELRVVVATVAFGMGLDKSDVRGIVHYNMPKSFESYVQEIGRAGRDGEPAHCHLFLDPEGGDLHELRRHIYADTVDYFTVKRLVQRVFPPCKCRQIHQKHQDLAKAAEVDDAELMELMELCEESGDNQREQNTKIQVTHLQQSASDTRPQESESKQEGECEGSITQYEGEEKQQGREETQRDQMDAKDGSGSGEIEQSEGEELVQRVCHTHERAVPMQDTVEALDITEEGLETLLCYLELHPQRWVELLHPTLSVCRLVCYGGPPQLRKLTKICPPVAVVLARKRLAGEKVETCDTLEFDVVELADTMGWQLPLVKRGLRQLQWSAGSGSYGGTGRSGILVEFSALSFYFRSYGDLMPEELDQVCAFLHGRVQSQERTQLYQLKTCFKAFHSVAYRNCSFCMDELDETRSLKLKELLSDYFDKRRDLDMSKKYEEDQDDEDKTLNKCKLKEWEEQIRADVRGFLASRSDEKFSGRAVARIFHGIGSPCYPAQMYGRDRRYWRKYIHFDFNEIIRLATQEIIRTR
ncbi:ATP-dependent DNA helicase Q4 [Pygocentrus nattereri]|uniref:ATP-dependent DNA helicase Q4 n=1 Tax=Pygocentrus nattereri TaxID=42514 RepID=UPI000814B3C7|nr:ATP-dependent DNA helicase Q4 [Pygocentrus nattereri]